MSAWISHFSVWLMLAAAHLLLPVGLLRRRKAPPDARRSTLAYGALTAAWGLAGALTALMELAPTVGKAAAWVFLGLTPLMAGMCVTLGRAFTRQERSWIWLVAGAVGGGLTIAAAWIRPQAGGIFAALGWGGLWTAHAALWVRYYARMGWAFRRNRALYWVLAALLLAAGQAAALGGAAVGAVGLLAHLGGLAAVVVAIPRRDLPNVRSALRRGVGYGLLAVAMGGLLTLSLLILSPNPGAALRLPALILAAVAAVGLAFAYEPLHALAARLAERVVPHVGYDMSEKLREYDLAISNVIDLGQLAAIVARTMSSMLDTDRAALILVTEEENIVRLRPMPGVGAFSLEEAKFDVRNPLVGYMHAGQKPLLQQNVEQDTAFQSLLPQLQRWLQQMGMEVYVPIFARAALLGVLAAGPARSGEPYGQREQSFMTTLAQQTSIALQNARMFDDMRALNSRITHINTELRRAMERVERLDQAKADFLTAASQELRTPLTHVKGYADLLLELYEAQSITLEQSAEITQNIGRAAERLESVIEAMVALSQLDRDHLTTFFAPTTLQAVMRIALEPWGRLTQERDLRLTVEGVGSIPPIIADLQWLAQAFGHLVSNAVKFTPDGGAITIRARQVDEAHFEVVVADTGVGIDPDDQELIFDKFYCVEGPAGARGGRSQSKPEVKESSAGLGLAIARRAIEAHGGRIWVMSERRDEIHCPGSEFHVLLPLKARAPDDAGASPPH